jgi:hydrogenase maturation protease
LGVEAQEQSGEATALLGVFESAPAGRRVIVVDAMVTGSPPGSISFWDAGAVRLSRETFRCSTHALGVAEAVELARALGKLPLQLGIYGIEGAGFEAGAQPSREVLRAVEELAHRIAREV